MSLEEVLVKNVVEAQHCLGEPARLAESQQTSYCHAIYSDLYICNAVRLFSRLRRALCTLHVPFGVRRDSLLRLPS